MPEGQCMQVQYSRRRSILTHRELRPEMSLMKTFALLQLLIIMNNVSVQAATLRIQGGSTVHVGDRVNITCTCDLLKCYQGVHFRISGVKYNFSTLEDGGVTNYNLEYTTDWNTLIYTLRLNSATVNDNGTTYQCTPSVHEGEVEKWSNTETLTVLDIFKTTTTTKLEEILIASSSENLTFPLRTINSYEWPIPTTTTTTMKGNFATPITKPTATPVPKPSTTGGPSQISISLDPQPALIGEDVEIRCTHNIQSVINYHPWIAVDGETTTLNTLTSQEKYSLNKSTIINGEAVYVVIMHNVRESDNGTTFECYFTLNGGEEIRSGTVALRVRHKATKQPSQIRISLDPQPSLIGDDIQIRCTVMQIPVLPRIAVNDKEETLQSLANRDKYTLTSSPITNGVAVYVLTLHNVSVSDNGTRFECFVRSHGRRITSGTRVLRVVQERITVNKGGPSTITTAPTTVKGSLYTTDLSEIVSTQVQTLEQSTFCVSPTILVAPKTSTVELYAILIPAGVLVTLLVISLLIIMIMALVLVKRRQHERGINGEEIGEILEERKENIYVM